MPDSRIDSRDGQGNRVQSLDRALDILEALAAAGGDLGLSELSQTVGLHISTVHRLLSVLVSRGYARQNAPNGRYAIGAQLLNLSALAASGGHFDLQRQAHAVLRQMVEASSETTNLVMPFDNQVVYVDQVPGQHMVRMFTQIGMRAPAYCTGAGKALLAYRTEQEIQTYLLREQLIPHTSRTITTPAALRADLRRIRERGYAYDQSEMEDGVHCVAAPVFDHNAVAVAAISISGPALRFDLGRMELVAPVLVQATRELSAALGHRASASTAGSANPQAG